MNLKEHITSVQDRMKMVGSEKATIQLDGENVVYSDWNNIPSWPPKMLS